MEEYYSPDNITLFMVNNTCSSILAWACARRCVLEDMRYNSSGSVSLVFSSWFIREYFLNFCAIGAFPPLPRPPWGYSFSWSSISVLSLFRRVSFSFPFYKRIISHLPLDFLGVRNIPFIIEGFLFKGRLPLLFLLFVFFSFFLLTLTWSLRMIAKQVAAQHFG